MTEFNIDPTTPEDNATRIEEIREILSGPIDEGMRDDLEDELLAFHTELLRIVGGESLGTWAELADEWRALARKPDLMRTLLDANIERHFPDRLMTFYTPGGHELAAVEDAEGNMWRVWADGGTEKYTR